jgi:hypothetical protein
VQQRPEDLAGDYEYDLAHEQNSGPRKTREEPHPEHPGPAPAHRSVEFDRDLSYDEAHDF